MARKNRGRGSQARLARPYPLDHTASRSRAPDLPSWDDESPSDFEGLFRPIPVRPLIRTVRIDSAPPQPRLVKRQSPLVQVRATMRSSDRAARSPFLNATAVTPQLADRAILCAKRTIRREVIFANRKTGKGSGAPRRKRSKVKC